LDYLHFSHRLLAELGGGDGDPFHEVVKHALPSVAWLLVFCIGVFLVASGRQSLNRWLLFAISFALFRELFYLLSAARWALADNSVSIEPAIHGHDSSWGAAWLTAQYLLLFFAVFKFMGFAGFKNKFSAIAQLALMLGALVFLGAQFHAAGLTVEDRFESQPIDAWVLFFNLLSILVLIYTLVQIYFVWHESQIARVAWLPFSFYLVSQVFIFIATFVNNDTSFWLIPIAHNFFNFAILGFGFVLCEGVSNERTLLSEQLGQSQRLAVVSSLTAGVAHDFNNHLQSIMGNAEVGKQFAIENKQPHQHFDNIIDSAERAHSVVSQLTRFSSESNQAMYLDTSLPDVIADLAPILDGLLGRGIQVVNLLDPEQDVVYVDRCKLEQAIINVALNARDAMPLGGKLTIRSERLESTGSRFERPLLRLFIQDTGEGIRDSEKNRVFEPFYTTKEPQSAGGSGSGLGLSTSRAAIQTMGGSMQVESTPGNGTTLIIDLPASSSKGIRDVQRAEKTRSIAEAINDIEYLTGTERILLADDEPGARHIASSQLIRAGYDVSIARDGVHALDIVRTSEQRFDLFVLDVIMPKKDGYTVYEEVKALQPSVPVVFVTANTHLVTNSRPAEPHLTKPYKQRALLQLVRKTIDSQLVV